MFGNTCNKTRKAKAVELEQPIDPKHRAPIRPAAPIAPKPQLAATDQSCAHWAQASVGSNVPRSISQTTSTHGFHAALHTRTSCCSAHKSPVLHCTKDSADESPWISWSPGCNGLIGILGSMDGSDSMGAMGEGKVQGPWGQLVLLDPKILLNFFKIFTQLSKTPLIKTLYAISVFWYH